MIAKYNRWGLLFGVTGIVLQVAGVMLAAALLITLPEALRGLSEYRLIIYALLLILMMLFRPQGLFGVHEIWDFFTGRRRTASGEANP